VEYTPTNKKYLTSHFSNDQRLLSIAYNHHKLNESFIQNRENNNFINFEHGQNMPHYNLKKEVHTDNF